MRKPIVGQRWRLATLLLLVASVATGQEVVFPGARAGRPSAGRCGAGSKCLPRADCPLSRFASPEQISRCTLRDAEQPAICCPTPATGRATASAAHQPAIRQPSDRLDTRTRSSPRISAATLRSSEVHARSQADSVRLLERRLENQRFQTHGAERAHSNFFGHSAAANRLGHRGELLVNMAIDLAQRSAVNRSRAASGFAGVSTRQNFPDCPVEPVCSSSRYRTPDGSCTNRQRPSWGRALGPFVRVLEPDYADQLSAPRVARSGRALPNARLLSTQISPRMRAPSAEHTVAMMQFGQFVDHDIVLTALTRTENGTAISCCGLAAGATKHPACLEIALPRNDPFFAGQRQTCMNFVRSSAATRVGCELGAREQINQLTAAIDASMVYGNSLEAQRSLRTFADGKLLTSSVRDGGQLLPAAVNGTCNVPPPSAVSRCFRGGDNRVNENVALTVFQTLFLRAHNALVEQLQQLNPGWSDEALYQETRRIVGALVQHVTYAELVPSILGQELAAQYGLLPLADGYFDGHDPRVDVGILSGFSSAAYRFHSMVQGTLQLLNNDGTPQASVPLAETFNNPTLLRRAGALDGLINGISSQVMQAMDTLFTDQIQNHLFRPHNSTFGLDLVAINIQRGRDHGIPSYNRWREACSLGAVRSFRQLAQLMPEPIAQLLSQHYETVDDVDLFVAGVAEFHLPNALVGPTFACIVAEQFRRLKVGDSFYYENGGLESSFTPAQLTALRRMSIARIFCDYGDQLRFMQPFAFLRPGAWWNEKVPCNSRMIPQLSLRPWANQNILG